MISIIAIKKPKWFQIRWKLSNVVAHLARSIYPENPEVKAFYIKMMTDKMIYGQAITRIDSTSFYKETYK